MDLCIKTANQDRIDATVSMRFNPCFNGSMYKNPKTLQTVKSDRLVSILVLMDLCIKTDVTSAKAKTIEKFQSLF
mgnify:FL=1